MTRQKGVAKRQTRGVIFDLDGTLIDSLEDIARSMNRVLQAAGYPGHAIEAYRYFVGDGVRALVERSLPGNGAHGEEIDPLVDKMRLQLAENWRTHTQPYPGIVAMLEQLKSAVPNLAVLSNKPHSLTVAHVNQFFPDIPFSPVLGVSETVPPKPNLSGANRILNQWGLDSHPIVYVGDTKTDMETAKAAGFYAVGVTWGFRTAEELLNHGADVLIDHPSELLAYC